jgi:hypothetical protein
LAAAGELGQAAFLQGADGTEDDSGDDPGFQLVAGAPVVAISRASDCSCRWEISRCRAHHPADAPETEGQAA